MKNYKNFNQIREHTDLAGESIDFIYNYGMLLVTDEQYGGTMRYEFQLDENVNFMPFI